MQLRDLFRAAASTAAIASGLAVFALDPTPIGLLAALMYAGFAYAIFQYWGQLENPLLILLYVLMVFAVAISVYQLVIFAAVVIALVVAAKRPSLATRPGPTLVYPLRLAGLAAGILAAPLILWYEAIRRGTWLYRLYMVLGGIGLVLSMVGLGFDVRPIASLLATPMLGQYLGIGPDASPLWWLGAIGWEEFISRAVGPMGNAFWVILHFPTRYLVLGVLGAIGAVSYIQIGARWLWDTYERGGIIGSLIGHATYNAVLSLLVEAPITLWPLVIIAAITLYFIAKPFAHA